MIAAYQRFQEVPARRVGVRPEYADEAVWRDALGRSAPLFVWSTDGGLDARDYSPAGSTVAGVMGNTLYVCGTSAAREPFEG